MSEPYSKMKQYVSFEERAAVMEEIGERLEDKHVYVGGTAYTAHAVSALMTLGIAKEDALKKVRYSVDLDIVVECSEKALEQLGPEYRRRFDKFAKDPKQRRKKIGRIELISGEEIDKYIPVDVMDPDYYANNFSEGDGLVAFVEMFTNAKESAIFGKGIHVQGLNDYIAQKMSRMKKTLDKGKSSPNDKYPCDVLNLMMLYHGSNELDLGYVSKMIGGKEVMGDVFDYMRESISKREVLFDNGLKRLKDEQIIPDDGKTGDLLIFSKETSLKVLNEIGENFNINTEKDD